MREQSSDRNEGGGAQVWGGWENQGGQSHGGRSWDSRELTGGWSGEGRTVTREVGEGMSVLEIVRRPG